MQRIYLHVGTVREHLTCADGAAAGRRHRRKPNPARAGPPGSRSTGAQPTGSDRTCRTGAGNAGWDNSNRHRPVCHHYSGAERRIASQRCINPRRSPVRKARHHRIRVRARRVQSTDHSRSRREQGAYPGKRHWCQWRVRSWRGPLCSRRPTDEQPSRGHPRACDIAFRVAGDRGRGRINQQPHSDLHSRSRDQCRVPRRWNLGQ